MVRIAVFTTALLALSGCATAAAPAASARTSVAACHALDPALASGESFDAPLTVVDARRVYRYEGRVQRRIPEGVVLRVHTTPGLSAPDVHRVVACRMGHGSETRISVTPRGPTYEVRVLSREPSVARAIQAAHAPSDG